MKNNTLIFICTMLITTLGLGSCSKNKDSNSAKNSQTESTIDSTKTTKPTTEMSEEDRDYQQKVLSSILKNCVLDFQPGGKQTIKLNSQEVADTCACTAQKFLDKFSVAELRRFEKENNMKAVVDNIKPALESCLVETTKPS